MVGLKIMVMKKRVLVGFFIVVLVMLFTFIFTSSLGREKPPLVEIEQGNEYSRFHDIRVEVINAAGAPGLARKVTFLLRKRGFDVVYYGNSREKLAHTVIVERVDSTLQNATALGGVIGCNNIMLDYDPDKLLEVSLLLGRDYSKFFPGIDTLVILF